MTEFRPSLFSCFYTLQDFNTMERKKCFVLMLAGLGTYLVYGIRLPACGSGGIAVSETARDVIVTCDQIGAGDTVFWQLVDDNGVQSALGSCSPSNCYPSSPNLYGLSRPSPTVSQLTLKTPSRPLAKYNISCSTPATIAAAASTCGLNIIYPAEVSNCRVQLQKINNTWTVTGSCDVTKVFASSGTYICQWFRGDSQSQTVSVTTTTYSPVPHSESGYWNGTCSLSSTDVVSTSGSFYHYRVVVSPGDTPKVFGPVSVESPINTSVACNPRPYVPENTDVTCTCSTQSVGQPAGRLMWFKGSDNNPINTGTYGNTSLIMTPQTMRRAQGDVQFRCDVDWATRITGQPYIVMISYGPDGVRIPENRTFYTDSAGSRDLSLNCQAINATPTTELIYTWTGRCPDVTTSRCTFRPRPPDSSSGNGIDAEVVCRVRNPRNNNLTTQDSFQLDLKYPPSSPPTMGNYSQGQVLYQGDNLTLTCTVTGGNPLVTSVSLTCPGHHDNGATSGQSSSLTIPSLSDADHRIECGCSGQWVRPDYYNLTDTRTLTVYYPPSVPNITRTDNLSFPYLEGDTVRLSCDLQSSRGNPNASLSWSGHGNDQINTPDGAPATLVMTSVGKGANNRNITCMASNAWTQHKGRDVSSHFTLRVYYSPLVTLTPLENNTCQTTDNGAVCAVIQGQRVHFTCGADSNPPPSIFVWSQDNSQDSALDIGTGPDLYITSADRRKHNGNFTCNVTTGSLQGTGRHPYSSSRSLTVLVRYFPEQTELTINNNAGNLTVRQGTTVVLACRADGRPTPNMRLVKKETGQEVHSVAGGDLVVDDRDSWLNYTVTTVSCSDTGAYTCTAGNDAGTGPTDSGALFVLCPPRYAGPPPVDIPSVNYRNQSVQLTFNLWAFPAPVSHHIVFLGSTLNTAANVTGILFDVNFRRTVELYNFTYDITVVKITNASAAGYYRLTVNNTLGEAQVVFQVKYNEHPESPGASGAAVLSTGAAVAVTLVVTVVVFVVLITALVVWMWRRRWILPCADAATKLFHTNIGQSVRLSTLQDNSPAEQTARQAASEYEDLMTREMGLASPYFVLTHYPNAGNTRDQDDVYKNRKNLEIATYENIASNT